MLNPRLLRFSAMPLLRMLVLGLVAALALPAAAQATKPKRQLYLSLGDSYATGYQVGANGQGANTRNGFAYQLPKLARPRGYRFKLVNFGCGAETTASLLERTTACSVPAPGGPRYTGRTQLAAAERFLRDRRGRVALITVSIGGNDITRCASDASPIACVAAAVDQIKTNVRTTAKRLRKAAGKKTRIVGLTYPDVILGQWVGPNANQDLARLSVIAFKDLINPALKSAYASADGRFLDVTRATGAYGRLDELVAFPPHQLVPKPVARVCELTYYCEFRDIHARTSGYKLIARLIAESLPKRKAR